MAYFGEKLSSLNKTRGEFDETEKTPYLVTFDTMKLSWYSHEYRISSTTGPPA